MAMAALVDKLIMDKTAQCQRVCETNELCVNGECPQTTWNTEDDGRGRWWLYILTLTTWRAQGRRHRLIVDLSCTLVVRPLHSYSADMRMCVKALSVFIFERASVIVYFRHPSCFMELWCVCGGDIDWHTMNGITARQKKEKDDFFLVEYGAEMVIQFKCGRNTIAVQRGLNSSRER